MSGKLIHAKCHGEIGQGPYLDVCLQCRDFWDSDVRTDNITAGVFRYWIRNIEPIYVLEEVADGRVRYTRLREVT